MNQCLNCLKELPLDNVQIGGVHIACELEYFKKKDILMVKFRPEGCDPWLIVDTGELIDQAKLIAEDDEETGETTMLEIIPIFMSKHEVAELEKLPEFQGW